MTTQNRLMTLAALTVTVVVCTLPVYGQFEEESNWNAFDPGADETGVDLDGYFGAAFDGRYIYFAPGHNGTQWHGEVLRYDTHGDFASLLSWDTYNPGANEVRLHARGFKDAVFDGRYVYFVPGQDEVDVHGEVLRYDTTAVFAEVSSWVAYDPGAAEVGSDPDGYTEALFDGRYLYFVPFNNGTETHGEVLRYDTTEDFITPSSWETYDPGVHDVGVHPDGYGGGVFDGPYLYFAPLQDSTGMHGEVMRYDTSAAFDDVSAWTAYDPGDHDIGINPDGYTDAVFDGRYVYFVPFENATEAHCEVLRYDTAGVFDEAPSWVVYDPKAAGLGEHPDSFNSAVFDGRYLYFAPHFNFTRGEEEILRYDTDGPFEEITSWAVFDPIAADVSSGVEGRAAVVFDGRYVYFTPSDWIEPHGEFLRYDTRTGIPTVSQWGLIVMTLLVLGTGTVILQRSH